MVTSPGIGSVRYGIIGVGLMGLEHLRDLAALPGAVVTAVSDPCLLYTSDAADE